MKIKLYIIHLFLICSSLATYAQNQSDTSLVARDTLSPKLMSTPKATASDIDIKISPNQPDLSINYGAVDSSYLNLRENQIHLFREAYVKYGKYNLNAGYIIFDFDNNEAAAFDTIPTGIKLSNPTFSDGQNNFTAQGLRYNFKTNKGIIYDAVTQQGEFMVHGARTKFVSSEADSVYTKDQIFNKNALITTCTAPKPHFGIRASKLKLIPNRLAVAGFSYLEIMGIPTPIVLPFGFYPMIDGVSSGVIFPADFETHPNLGLGVRGVGYFFPISQYMNLRITGDFYTRGTHRIYANMNFKKRYKYSGYLNLSYANNIVENPTNLRTVSQKGFKLKAQRTQDPKAHPYQSVSGNIDIIYGDFNSVNFNDYQNTTQNQYGSNFGYRNSMPGTPFSFSADMRHNQNVGTHKFNITLPDLKLTMTTIYPFKREVQTGGERWYEKINLSGSSAFKSLVSTTDTMLLTPQTLDTIQLGMLNKASSSASFKALKYFNVSPRVSIDQYVMFKSLDKTFDSTLLLDSTGVSYDQDSVATILYDTTYGRVLEDLNYNFSTLHKFSTGVTINTALFATKNFSKGWFRGVRHIMKPSMSFSYTPGTDHREQIVQVTNDPRAVSNFDRYNPYQGNPFNPSLNSESRSVSMSINNTLEGKYYSNRDSTTKKFWILQSFYAGTNYNFAADSLHWSPLTFRGNTRLTKFTRLNFDGRYDFYEMNENGRRINKTIWESKKRPLDFRLLNITLSTNFKFKDIIQAFSKKKEVATEGKEPKEKTTLASAIENFSVAHTYTLRLERQPEGRDSLYSSTHTLRLSGTVPLTPKWNLQVQNISYDFVRKDFIYPSFALTRDLHCWQMNFSWYPKGGVFAFGIGVKSSALSFLRYDYGKQNPVRLSGLGR